MTADARIVNYVESLASVVRAGLRANQMSGIQDLLETVAHESSAFGCVLWESYPGSILTPEKREGGFFALAQWFENGRIWAQHDIPVDSATGYAIANDLPSYAIANIFEDEHSYKADFLKENGILRACIIPLRFIDGAIGALDVFRTETQNPFSPPEEASIRRVADLLPALYETVRDEVAYRCSRSVNDLLPKFSDTGSPESNRDLLYTVADQFCLLLKNNLCCFDVSVYFEQEDTPDVYLLHGSTLPDRSFTSSSYKKGEIGPTAAAVTYRRGIEILDLRRPKTFPRGIALSEPNPRYIEYLQQQAASHRDSPLSFMATPILAGDRILGVLRCCVPMSGPTYFATREADLLMLLAGQIGHFVSHERSRAEVYRENQAYRVIIDSISSLTDLVYLELKESKPDEDRVLNKGLDAIASALPGEQWIGIGVHESSGKYMRRNVRSLSKTDQPKQSVELPAPWRADLTVGRGILRNRQQLESTESSLYTASLSGVPNGLLLAPIQSRDQSWFLEIVNTGKSEFPKHAIAIATLLGKQLGIYHDLLTTIVQVKLAQSELQERIKTEKRMAQAQAQAMMDLEHQIRAPLRHARTRVPSLFKLAGSNASQALTKQLQYLRGNLRRAARVAGNARLFSRLALGDAIECRFSMPTYEDIRQLLIEAAMDNMLITDEREPKGITFGVDEESFAKVGSEGKIRLDTDLLDQAINDLLDNAGKYSDPNTRVRIEVSLTRASFIVTVTNRGLKISPDQIPILKRRGERGAIAKLAAGEGSGIGLWIADEIMKAHNGSLDIVPTTADRTTRIRLVFPTMRN